MNVDNTLKDMWCNVWIFNTRGWVWQGDVLPPVQSMKLMVSKTFDLDSRELSTCTMSMNGGYYLRVQPAFNKWEGLSPPLPQKWILGSILWCFVLMYWERELEDFVVPCVVVLHVRDRVEGAFCGAMCSSYNRGRELEDSFVLLHVVIVCVREGG